MHVTGQREQSPHLPPRWFIRSFWVVQRALYSVTRGRFGLRTATADHQGHDATPDDRASHAVRSARPSSATSRTVPTWSPWP